MEKICIQCKEVKDISLFYIDKRIKGGFRNKCKKCTCENNKIWVNANQEKNRKSINEWRRKNPHYNKNYQKINGKKIYKNRKDYLNEYNKKYVVENDYHKKYYVNNKDILLNKKKEWIKENPDYHINYNREYRREKRKDVLYRIKESVSNMIRYSFRSIRIIKNRKSIDILGCDILEFRTYLESKFESWMTWENYGKYNGELNFGWDIDHIIPTSCAKNEEDIIRLNHYTNLQPLCSYVNRHIKRDTII